MDAVQWHLLLNHFPILGTLFGSFILLAGIILKNKSLSLCGLIIFIAVAVLTIPAFKTGEEAEEIVEEIPGISHKLVHIHEEAAEIAWWLMEGLGLLSIVAVWLVWKEKLMKNLALWISLLFSFLVFATMFRVGKTGGEIRRSETGKTIPAKNMEDDD